MRLALILLSIVPRPPILLLVTLVTLLIGIRTKVLMDLVSKRELISMPEFIRVDCFDFPDPKNIKAPSY